MRELLDLPLHLPDGGIIPLSPVIDALETAGFEVRDVKSLCEHYGLTLRAWMSNLEAQWDEAVRLTWRLSSGQLQRGDAGGAFLIG